MRYLLFLSLLVLGWSCGADTAPDDKKTDDKTEEIKPSLDLTIRPGVGFGEFTEEQSKQDLLKTLKKNNVIDKEFYLGEGEYAPGLVLYPGTKREVEVLIDEEGYPLIYRINQAESEWRGPEGLTIGTSLVELEKMNGKPFRLTGFEWDYGGTITNWDGGALDQSGFRIVLGYDYEAVKFTEEDMNELLGDHEFSSTLPALKRYPIEVVRIEQGY